MAQIISGREVSKEIEEKLKEKVAGLSVQPVLAIVQVGNREDSNVYIRMKKRFAESVGVGIKHITLGKSTTEDELINNVKALNKDSNVHGIIVQLPFDSENKIDADKVTNIVSPDKDVDGLSDLNAGKLFHGQVNGQSCFLPCTPNGCIELIKKSGVKIAGSYAVVIGRSKIVGSPMAQLLLWHNATVTILHSRTPNPAEFVRLADIVVVGAGVPELVKADWLKPGAVVIDCGITAVPDPTKKSGQRLVGDVAFAECKEVASAITPVRIDCDLSQLLIADQKVPGGVGAMTVAMLISNTVDAAIKQSQIAQRHNCEL